MFQGVQRPFGGFQSDWLTERFRNFQMRFSDSHRFSGELQGSTMGVPAAFQGLEEILVLQEALWGFTDSQVNFRGASRGAFRNVSIYFKAFHKVFERFKELS